MSILQCLLYRQTDILDAVDQVNAETIFILPNNKNIILAANQAAELMTDKNLLVIPTKTIPQGITAVINYVPEMSVASSFCRRLASSSCTSLP